MKFTLSFENGALRIKLEAENKKESVLLSLIKDENLSIASYDSGPDGLRVRVLSFSKRHGDVLHVPELKKLNKEAP